MPYIYPNANTKVEDLDGPFSDGGGGSSVKAGLIDGASFSGTPKKATVTFVTAMASTNYSISISSTDGRSFTYESKSTTGFVINANADTAIAGAVSWMATPIGE